MTLRTKSTIILLATFALGIAVGFLLHARMVDERMERMARLRSPEGFTRYYLKAIEPRDDGQEAQIKAVLDDAGRRIRSVAATRREEIHAIVDETKDRLAPLLTPEQMERLEHRMEERRLRHERRKEKYRQAEERD